MSGETIDDFYANLLQNIEAGDADHSLNMILGLGDIYMQLNILSRLAHELDGELNRARVRAFESANSLIGANSSIRASAAIFALGLGRASISAASLYRVFDRISPSTPEIKPELFTALKYEREIELELGKLSRTLKLDPDLESELAKLIKINSLILRVLESLIV